jgi:hypothetical protein
MKPILVITAGVGVALVISAGTLVSAESFIAPTPVQHSVIQSIPYDPGTPVVWVSESRCVNWWERVSPSPVSVTSDELAYICARIVHDNNKFTVNRFMFNGQVVR